MCALCGAFGEEHWSTGHPGSALPGVSADGQTRRAGRLARLRAANAVLAPFAMRLDDFQGARFVLSGPTGQREVVDSLPQAWDAAARIRGRPIDPLDPALIARMAERLAS